MLPSETMIWQPEFTDKILSRKPGAVHFDGELPECLITFQRVTLELFQGKFALSWFDRFPVQVEQQKEMAAVIDQWRETTCSSTSKC
jgi:hypothetical protein